MMEDRIITTDFIEEDYKIENNLRPQLLVDYIGQSAVKDKSCTPAPAPRPTKL